MIFKIIMILKFGALKIYIYMLITQINILKKKLYFIIFITKKFKEISEFIKNK